MNGANREFVTLRRSQLTFLFFHSSVFLNNGVHWRSNLYEPALDESDIPAPDPGETSAPAFGRRTVGAIPDLATPPATFSWFESSAALGAWSPREGGTLVG
jgi:hypothetical protein